MDSLNDIISELKWGNLNPIEAHDRVLRLVKVSKTFTAEEVVNKLEDCDTLDDAIMFFKEQM